MARFKKVYAPPGADTVNVGTESFSVDITGEMMVPEEAVGSLMATGGYTTDDNSGPAPDGFVVVRHKDRNASFSFGGVSYGSRPDGTFLAPAVAVIDLIAHGFVADEAATEDEVVDDAQSVIPTPKLKIPTK